MNQELPDVQAGFIKTEESEIKLSTTIGSQKKTRELKKKKKIYFWYIDENETFDCVDHSKLWEILRDGNNRPPYLSPGKPICRARRNS